MFIIFSFMNQRLKLKAKALIKMINVSVSHICQMLYPDQVCWLGSGLYSWQGAEAQSGEQWSSGGGLLSTAAIISAGRINIYESWQQTFAKFTQCPETGEVPY